MAILDAQGRLFGKFSILDVGAGLIILMVVVGIFLLPGKTTSFAQGTPVEVDVLVRGLSATNPKELLQPGQKINVIIRNEPSGTVNLKNVQFLPRTVSVPQPDGSVKALPDPRPELSFSNDMIMTLGGNARQTADGLVFGNKKVKVGVSLELEGTNYNFNSTVISIRNQK